MKQKTESREEGKKSELKRKRMFQETGDKTEAKRMKWKRIQNKTN